MWPSCRFAPLPAGPLSDVGHSDDSAMAILTLDIFASGPGITRAPHSLWTFRIRIGSCARESLQTAGRQRCIHVLCLYRYLASTMRGGPTLVQIVQPFGVDFQLLPPRPGRLLGERRTKDSELQSRCHTSTRRRHYIQTIEQPRVVHPNDACNRQEKLTWHTH